MWFSATFAILAALLLASSAAAKPGEKSRKYCDETHALKGGRVRRIIGGSDAPAKEFPHMVLLGYEENDNVTWLCDGSLINDKYVLTAANCIARILPSLVRLGFVNKDDGSGRTVKVAKLIRHPDYKPPSSYNDLGLIELEESLKFNEDIKPACLNSDPDLGVIGANEFIATGWGTTSYDGAEPTRLQQVNLEEVSLEECRKVYMNNRKLANGIMKESQICAGGSGKDTCSGDAGGPLQVLNPKYVSAYDIHGITSFGKLCGVYPGVYTRVTHYIDWIESVAFK